MDSGTGNVRRIETRSGGLTLYVARNRDLLACSSTLSQHCAVVCLFTLILFVPPRAVSVNVALWQTLLMFVRLLPSTA